MEKRVAIELDDIVAEPGGTAAIKVLRRRMRRESDQRRVLPAAVVLDRARELESVHPRHLDVADDDIEIFALLAEGQRAVGGLDGGHLVARHRQQRRQQIAEEWAVVHEQHPLALLALELAVAARAE